MRHSLEPEYRKFVKGYGFLSFARSFGDKYGKKLVDSAKNSGLKKVVTETSKNFAINCIKKGIK